jgi:hypothetical protein
MSFGYQVEYILIYLSIFKIFKELVFICNHDSRKKLELKKKKTSHKTVNSLPILSWKWLIL